MNLRDLHYLVALADARHFGHAAEAANVSQPTLSGQIRKLEDELGVRLFERGSGTVAPTPAGRAVLEEARQVLAHAAAIRDIATAYRDPLAGPFRLGVIASLAPFLAPVLLERLQHEAPRLEMQLTEALTDDLVAGLRARQLDAALLATAVAGEDLGERPLFDEPFLLAHAPGHPLAALPHPGLDDVAGGTLMLLDEGHCLRDQALALCRSGIVDPRVKATSLTTLMRLAASGHGATLVPALAARGAAGLVMRGLAAGGAVRRIRLVARRSDPRLTALSLVGDAARGVARGAGLAPVYGS